MKYGWIDIWMALRRYRIDLGVLWQMIDAGWIPAERRGRTIFVSESVIASAYRRR